MRYLLILLLLAGCCAVTGTCPDQLVPAADFKPEEQKP
jgi:hypothetical protein